MLNAQHKRVEEKDFTDDTTATVKGAVLFPKHLVEGSTECGVLGATIEVLESDGEPEEYKTDAQGQFEIAVTRGKTFKFLAKLKGHTLCYAGTSVQDAVDRTSACSQTDSVDVTLTNVGDGNTLYFVDSTIRYIDLGLYAGECNARYAGATFKITPRQWLPPICVSNERRNRRLEICHQSRNSSTRKVSGVAVRSDGLHRNPSYRAKQRRVSRVKAS